MAQYSDSAIVIVPLFILNKLLPCVSFYFNASDIFYYEL
ncbi:hypothetical protein SAMN05421784_10577 [Xenorhabdus koppenhoeferi]|uniref:Uncharacterized protein n=1 Tax=Xenorhabdus koppenhoeferi TaxID=351659 RepID=A0A1I7FU64_9GAMM|nr:hypothetical protein SAMN05421784_10577 [Xenorhabdus koppenhoeferi]